MFLKQDEFYFSEVNYHQNLSNFTNAKLCKKKIYVLNKTQQYIESSHTAYRL